MAAKPEFDLYQYRSGDDIRFTVEYNLYDQYGTALRSTTVTQTGRAGTALVAKLTYELYSRAASADTRVERVGDAGVEDEMTITPRGRITEPVDVTIQSNSIDHDGFLVLLKPRIFSDSISGGNMNGWLDVGDTNEVSYVASPQVVWIVEDATGTGDFPESCDLDTHRSVLMSNPNSLRSTLTSGSSAPASLCGVTTAVTGSLVLTGQLAWLSLRTSCWTQHWPI